MDQFIQSVLDTLYPFIAHDERFSYMTKDELKSIKTVSTNCGINSELLFDLLRISNESVIYWSKLSEFESKMNSENANGLDENTIYKVYSVWDHNAGGHPHVANFYCDNHQWIFTESRANVSKLRFTRYSKEGLLESLNGREKISRWQEIVGCKMDLSKPNIMKNKETYIANFR